MRMGMIRSAAVLAMLSLFGGSVAAASSYDLVIRNGRVVNPETGLDALRNVGIRDGRIAAVTAEKLTGKKVIDASGLVVAPGFIDLHAHGQQLPAARMQAFEGVTTALELEGGKLPVADFYKAVAAEGRPINYGASVNWAMARAMVMDGVTPGGDDDKIFNYSKWTTDLATGEQSAKILSLIEQGLKEGGLGVGILLGYSPGSGHKEFYAVNELAARYRAPTFTHVRNLSMTEPQSSFEAYQEMIATAAGTGAHMHICHLNSTSLRDIPLAVNLISGAQARGVPVTVEAYPYGAGSTSIGGAMFQGEGWQARMGGVQETDFDLDGKPLTEDEFNKLQKEAPATTIVVHFLHPDKNPEDQAYLDMSVLYPGGAIASDGMPWTVDGKILEGDVWPLPKNAFAHPRSSGTFTRFLRQYVREREKLTLLEAIRKVSLIPAQILEDSVPQMKVKGRLSVGADADIVIFDLATVSDRGTFQEPAQTSVGMRYVIVNGTPVIEKGKLLRDARPGRAIRRTVD